ncbi:hypothetical protein G7078_06760 [Sphingomonas sinipercae]|uniref:ECF transporter S component n=1 Tax=Sphingomonas sinipercae TaxID=2714944 RepID=A0A6G7ZNN7_9SPHN|nr:DUF6580 family putative transport protein [Sphingomonas sinipercae]QIL02520.1 hypothetical protein G7078_06760 [Sphingomonas sinipercae]
MTANNTRILVLVTAILAAAMFRLLPHPANFSPIAAIALFGGAHLPRRTLGFVAPFGALLLSDAVLGFYPGISLVYLAVAITVLIGWVISSRRSVLQVAGGALASSVLFFVLSNFGTWLMMDMYPKSAAGLVACYAAAIPFFQNTVAGDLFFAGLLFGGFALLERAVPILRERPVAATA